jgi:hypothetical protein
MRKFLGTKRSVQFKITILEQAQTVKCDGQRGKITLWSIFYACSLALAHGAPPHDQPVRKQQEPREPFGKNEVKSLFQTGEVVLS